MHNLEVNGTKVRVTKYKVIIYEGKEEVTEEIAANIAVYLKSEGFIKREEIAVEIVPSNS